jgi:hypothetical protein
MVVAEFVGVVFGERVPSVTSYPKSPNLLTVVAANLKLTSSEWSSYDSHAPTVEVTYLKAARSIAP